MKQHSLSAIVRIAIGEALEVATNDSSSIMFKSGPYSLHERHSNEIETAQVKAHHCG